MVLKGLWNERNKANTAFGTIVAFFFLFWFFFPDFIFMFRATPTMNIVLRVSRRLLASGQLTSITPRHQSRKKKTSGGGKNEKKRKKTEKKVIFLRKKTSTLHPLSTLSLSLLSKLGQTTVKLGKTQ